MLELGQSDKIIIYLLVSYLRIKFIFTVMRLSSAAGKERFLLLVIKSQIQILKI